MLEKGFADISLACNVVLLEMRSASNPVITVIEFFDEATRA